MLPRVRIWPSRVLAAAMQLLRTFWQLRTMWTNILGVVAVGGILQLGFLALLTSSFDVTRTLGDAAQKILAQPEGVVVCALVVTLILWVLVRHLYIHARQQTMGAGQWSSWTAFLGIFLVTQWLIVEMRGVSPIKDNGVVTFTLLIIALSYLALNAGALLVAYLRRKRTREQLQQSWYKSYPNGSVGRGTDLHYDFSSSADDFARALAKERGYVSLFGLYGGMGQGKSSFWRMTLESQELKPEETLYTYISLTEANETADLSSLFAERWLGTLKERYPLEFALSKLQLERLRSVLRETKRGSFILAFLAFLEHFNKPLFKMRVSDNGFDPYLLAKPPQHVEVDDVRKMFNYLPGIHEKRWIICFDEIERASMKEVLRAIEIAERFKQIGQTGLPVQVLFVFLYDEHELAQRCDPRYKQDEQFDLVSGFFIHNPKLFTQKWSVPFVSETRRTTRIDTELHQIFTRNRLPLVARDGFHNPQDIARNHPFRDEFYNRRATYDVVLQLLAGESLRTIQRILDRVEAIYTGLPKTQAAKRFKRTYMPDLLAFALCEAKYPAVLRVVSKGYDLLYGSDRDRHVDYEIRRMRLDREKEQERKTGTPRTTPAEHIKEELGVDISFQDDGRTMRLLNILLPQLWTALEEGRDMNSGELLRLKDRLAFPDNLMVVFSLSPQQDSRLFRNMRWYEELVLDHRLPVKLSGDAAAMVRFVPLYRAQSSDERQRAKHTLMIMEEIIRLLGDASSWQPFDFGNQSAGHTLSLHFAQLLVDLNSMNNTTREEQAQAKRLFRQVIEDETIPLSYRLRIIDKFALSSNEVSEYKQVRESLLESDGAHPTVLIQRFATLKRSFQEKYTDTKNSIYALEPEPHYVLRSFSSGEPNDPELPTLQKVALRGLTHHDNSPVLNHIFLDLLPPPPHDTFNDFKSAYEVRGQNYLQHFPRPHQLFPLSELLPASRQNAAFKEEMQQSTELQRRYQFWLRASKDKEVTLLKPQHIGRTVQNAIDTLREEIEVRRGMQQAAATPPQTPHPLPAA
jgi:hypothetical protein